ncbi:phthiocerol/phthiodiolone dimycocerosyl transferase family protein [Streptomyces prasinus]|uniref:phthiocerol/phthiodiolone dimycocerosyl transferase family protein n=1 Tax=Streptomyces prasinus TaxID=67345 RepID=UPI0033DFC5B6
MSPAERWYWIIDQLSTLNVCARVRIEGELSAAVLRNALDELQTRNPMLRLAITEEPSDSGAAGPRFVPTDDAIPLREVTLGESDDARWVREVDGHELVEPIGRRSGPLARAVVVGQPGQIHDLLLTVPHCISDGTTALALLRQWVRLAAEPPAPGRDPAGNGPAPVPAPVEALFPAHHRVLSGTLPDRAAADEDGPGTDPGEVGRLEPERFVPFDRRRTRLLHRFFDSGVLQSLTAACRREGVTLHGVLAAAMASAVARDAAAPPPAHFAVGSPVAFRDELERPVPEDEVGCYVSAVHSVVRYRPEDLWSMARFINRDIAERRRRGEQYEVFGLLADQGPAGVADSGPLVQYIEEHGSFNFFVSNIGRFDFPGKLGSWALSGAQFVGGISVVGYFASSVTTSHGQLSWNFTYIDEAISRERAERLVDDSVRTVLAAAEAAV